MCICLRACLLRFFAFVIFSAPAAAAPAPFSGLLLQLGLPPTDLSRRFQLFDAGLGQRAAVGVRDAPRELDRVADEPPPGGWRLANDGVHDVLFSFEHLSGVLIDKVLQHEVARVQARRLPSDEQIRTQRADCRLRVLIRDDEGRPVHFAEFFLAGQCTSRCTQAHPASGLMPIFSHQQSPPVFCWRCDASRNPR